MKKLLVSLAFGLVVIGGFLFSQAAVACSTQTLIIGGKMTVCTVCGSVISCI